MKISYIITINPVIPIDYLNALINSLNLQSCKESDVILYNQTWNNEAKIFSFMNTIFMTIKVCPIGKLRGGGIALKP